MDPVARRSAWSKRWAASCRVSSRLAKLSRARVLPPEPAPYLWSTPSLPKDLDKQPIHLTAQCWRCACEWCAPNARSVGRRCEETPRAMTFRPMAKCAGQCTLPGVTTSPMCSSANRITSIVLSWAMSKLVSQPETRRFVKPGGIGQRAKGGADLLNVHRTRAPFRKRIPHPHQTGRSSSAA